MDHRIGFPAFATRHAFLAAMLFAACNDPRSAPARGPEVSDAGTEPDGGEPFQLWPSTFVFKWGDPNWLGHRVVEDEGQFLVDGSEENRCVTGPMQFTPVTRKIRKTRLADAPREQIQAALESPSGEGFMGRDQVFTEFYDAMTLPNSMAIAHVRTADAGTLSFQNEPTPTEKSCEHYVSRQALGARFSVGLVFEFSSENSLKQFRDQNPGLDLEQILRSGSTSVPLAFGEQGEGVRLIRVVMARIGGGSAPELPEVRANCATSDLRGCAQLLDELDAHAQQWLEALPTPTVEDPGPWVGVRLDIGRPAAVQP